MTGKNAGSMMLEFSAVALAATGVALAESPRPCTDCHQKEYPAIVDQWTESRHHAAGVGCRDCHGAEKDEAGACKHYKHYISIIVSPRDCAPCHEKEHDEFSRSAHARAQECVDRKRCQVPPGTVMSCGRLIVDFIEGNVAGHPSSAGALAAGINGCWQCHGSVVEILEGGRPDPTTWPNAGVGRVNPDKSVGNCAACHQRHTFSLAEARRPGLCGVCHNEGGGEPQLEIYNLSRHGTIYHHGVARMNLDSPRWIAGEDYSLAPTCATCHFSAARDLPATHDVDARILNRTPNPTKEEYEKLEIARDLTCRCGLDFCSHCKAREPWWRPEPESNPACVVTGFPDDRPVQYMTGVCRSCHSDSLIDNYRRQYLEEVDLVMTKWVEPGRRLYDKATEVLAALEGGRYAKLTQPVAGAWGSICNHGAKFAMYGAAMMSPGFTEASNGNLSSSWYYSFLPALAGLIEANVDSSDAEVRRLACELKEEFCEVLDNPTYGTAWALGDPSVERQHFCYNWIQEDTCEGPRRDDGS